MGGGEMEWGGVRRWIGGIYRERHGRREGGREGGRVERGTEGERKQRGMGGEGGARGWDEEGDREGGRRGRGDTINILMSDAIL